MEGGDATMIPSKKPSAAGDDELAVLQGAVCPKPERNHLLFPPRGGNRPVLRQILSEPDIHREFHGDYAENVSAEKARIQRRRPDPREDPSHIKDGGLLGLLQTLDTQKAGATGSQPSRTRSPRRKTDKKAVTFGGSQSSPAFHAKEKVKKDRTTEFREGMNQLLHTLDKQNVQKKKDDAIRMENIKAQQRVLDDQMRFLKGLSKNEERPEWTYCDPADYFENPNMKIEKDVSHTNTKVPLLMGIYGVKSDHFKPPHAEEGGGADGWNPHARNARECALDALGNGVREDGGGYLVKADGKPKELSDIDKRIKEVGQRRLKLMNFTESQKEKENPRVKNYLKMISECEQELEELKAQQSDWMMTWRQATVTPGLTGQEHDEAGKKALAAETQPPGSNGQPSKMHHTESHFAQRLDRKMVEADRLRAMDSLVKSCGTLRRQEMMKNVDPNSCLKREMPAWQEQQTTTHTYFSSPETYLPGDHPYTTGLDRHIHQSERGISMEPDMVVGDGERTSFRKAKKPGEVAGNSLLAAHAQALLCPPGCKKILSMSRSKSSPTIDLSATPGQLMKTTSGHLKKNPDGGTPCRTAAVGLRSVGSWAPPPKLGS